MNAILFSFLYLRDFAERKHLFWIDKLQIALLYSCFAEIRDENKRRSSNRTMMKQNPFHLFAKYFTVTVLVFSRHSPFLFRSSFYCSALTTNTNTMASTTTTYLITGASSGIGLEFVKQLAGRTSAGATHVIATCRKKTSSATGSDEISSLKAAEGNAITIVEGIDVCSDDCKDKLLEKIPESCKTIDVVVHNAGGMGSKSRDVQSFENVTPDLILNNVNLNAVGPLRIQQALHSKGYMGKDNGGGKVVLITSGLGSIGDNTSGGMYAYRGSKALANMVFKGLSCDLKPMGISVVAMAPGFVQTEFGGFGKDNMAKMGAIPVETSVGQMIRGIDDLSLETTGRYMCVDKNGSAPKEFAAGW